MTAREIGKNRGKIQTVTHMEKTMKHSLLVCLAVGALVSNLAMAADPAELAKAKNCLACHSVANKVVGPAYKDVAAKYAGQKGAEDKLVKKVIHGGSGAWGAIPMPANAQVNEAEAHTLVKWILSLK
jgi:cytochrome c